jgi:nucleoside-diphosphate-sugar epimerase
MNVLVTGATGFIGRHLVERLTNEGDRVKALVRPETSTSWLDALGVEVVCGDLCNAQAVERAAEHCQVVFHLAAKTEALGLLSRKDVQMANVQGTENVARAALQTGVDRVVFCSSVSVYGRVIKNRRIDEKTANHPDTAYGESKVLAERAVLSHHKRHGLPVVVARISTVFGPRALSWLGLYRSIASGHFRLIGAGHNHHHLVDVSDVIEGILLCGSVKGVEGRTYILAGSESVQLRELVQMIGEEVGVTRFRDNLPAAPLHVYRVLDMITSTVIGRRLPRADRLALFLGDKSFDISRGRQELGYVPKVNPRETIRRTADWFRTQGYLPPLNGRPCQRGERVYHDR